MINRCLNQAEMSKYNRYTRKGKERWLVYMKKEIEELNEVYRTIAQLTSLEDSIVLYEHFKGLTVNFPTRLTDIEYIKKYIKQEMQKQPVNRQIIQKWAIRFNYSERQIRRIIKLVQDDDLQKHSP